MFEASPRDKTPDDAAAVSPDGVTAVTGWRRLFPVVFLVTFAILVSSVMFLGALTERGPTYFAKGIQGFSQTLDDAVLTDLGHDKGTPPWPFDKALSEGAPVTLPHRLGNSIAQPHYFNYRVEIDAAAPTADAKNLGICIPRWSTMATIWLDGQEILSSAPGAAGLRDWTHAHFVSLPPGLQPGLHQLDVRIRALPELNPGLSEVWVGDSTLIRYACGSYEESLQTQKIGAGRMMALLAVVSLALLVLRLDPHAIYLFLIPLGWFAHQMIAGAVWVPADEETWRLLYAVSRPSRAIPIFLFCLSYMEMGNSWTKKILVGYFALAFTVAFFIDLRFLNVWLSFTGVTGVFFGLGIFAPFARHVLNKSTYSGYVLCAAFMVVFLANTLEFLRWAGFVPHGGVSWTFVGAPWFMAGLITLALERLARYAKNEVKAAATLRTEVELQRLQISNDFTTLQKQREKIAVLEERKRIFRDMHDGLGSQLVSASALLQTSGREDQALNALVESALQELRSVLDVLSTSAAESADDTEAGRDGDPVSLLLAKLRQRIGPVFRARGIELVWQAGELPPDFLPDDHLRLQLLRLIQEALTNVLKHAGARSAWLRSGMSANTLFIEVQDNGTGFAPGQPVTGHGLANMRVRAEQLGAAFAIDSTGSGTRVRLVFPWVFRARDEAGAQSPAQASLAQETAGESVGESSHELNSETKK